MATTFAAAPWAQRCAPTLALGVLLRRGVLAASLALHAGLSTRLLSSRSAVAHSCRSVYPQQWICGEVEELLVEADPEYNALQDTFRSSRRSNAARLALLYKLSFKLREAVARKTIRLGGERLPGQPPYPSLPCPALPCPATHVRDGHAPSCAPPCPQHRCPPLCDDCGCSGIRSKRRPCLSAAL